MIDFGIRSPIKKKEKPKPPKSVKIRYELQFDSIRDKSIIEKFNKQPNKAEYIRTLIKRDIKRDRRAVNPER